MSITDDDIIRRKLLIDGDGGNDDRRITNLLRLFLKWCNSSESEEESQSGATYQRMLYTLSQCEHAFEKSVMVCEINKQEQENYEQLNKDIEKNLEDAHEKIAQCKIDLQKAKRIRKNRQEYDALAKVIQQHPDRQETLKKLEALDKELESLKDSKQSLEEKLELRRKQFHVLITAIHEMQRILEDDEQNESSEMDQS